MKLNPLQFFAAGDFAFSGRNPEKTYFIDFPPYM